LDDINFEDAIKTTIIDFVSRQGRWHPPRIYVKTSDDEYLITGELTGLAIEKLYDAGYYGDDDYESALNIFERRMRLGKA